ncbi:MAG: hypothetical protein WCI03_07140 [bacterium]
MNLQGIDNAKITGARQRLESWFNGMHGPDGYYGPVVGFRGISMGYCGPGFDWRYEGLLDGWLLQSQTGSDFVRLERIEGALAEIWRSQLANGTLRCSYFESNPSEGSMPHEPILMAAALRARACLCLAGRPVDSGLDTLVERFVEERLTRELWNKALRTFNNWLQSEYEFYSPSAVSAIVEVLIGYEEATGQTSALEPMIKGAADSLLAVQIKTGSLAGGVPVSNRSGSPVSPYLAARCQVAFSLLRRRLNDERFAQAGDALESFLRKVARKEGGFPSLVHQERPASEFPVFVGAAAGVLTSLARSGRLTDDWLQPHLTLILGQQTESGAFNTAQGFNGGIRAIPPDWRDVVPVCGWADKVYHLLSLLQSSTFALAPVGAVHRDVTIRGIPAVFEEDDRTIRLFSGSDNVWFEWEKRTKWPRICNL